MSAHELKSWPEPFDAAASGKKCHEYRRYDRDFKVGDSLVLLRYDPKEKKYTGKRLVLLVTYISYGPSFEIPKGYCVMSTLRAKCLKKAIRP